MLQSEQEARHDKLSVVFIYNRFLNPQHLDEGASRLAGGVRKEAVREMRLGEFKGDMALGTSHG